ncbi:hypothetical protein CRE_15955 [Caenorhabditis remanei]|uniref:F-box domain-containing protein n=1 Tax=Caenorhabditis remanei TaxID=31234 RepID=E3MBR8_CAERE|nr:hypothetical protein CRE_15955 [Caenorhabditis remanei]
MFSGSPLLLLPDLVMDEVLKNLDMNSLFTLKKVSRGLRVFIARKKLDFKISTLTISVKKDVACLTLFIDGEQYACIEYGRKDENATLVSSLHKKNLVSMEYLDALCKDLEIILKHQKLIIEKFEVLISGGPEINNFDILEHQTKKFLIDLKNILKCRESLIKAKFLKMEILNQNQVMQVLPFLNAKTLDAILLSNSRGSMNFLNLYHIANLDQWKNASAFQTERFIVSQAMVDFAHFSYTGTIFETSYRN